MDRVAFLVGMLSLSFRPLGVLLDCLCVARVVAECSRGSLVASQARGAHAAAVEGRFTSRAPVSVPSGVSSVLGWCGRHGVIAWAHM